MRLAKIVAIFLLACSLGVNVADAFSLSWFSDSSFPKILDSVSSVNQNNWGSANYTCNKDYKNAAGGDSGVKSKCSLTYPELQTGSLPTNFSFTGDFGPQANTLLDHTTSGLSAPFPTNSWMEQAYWSRYRQFGPLAAAGGSNTIIKGDSAGKSDIFSGNYNCVSADWHACTVTAGDGYAVGYNLPVRIFPQPIGINLIHPQYSNGYSNAGLLIYGNQKSYGTTMDSSAMQANCKGQVNHLKDGLCGYTNVQQGKFYNIQIRPAGTFMAKAVLSPEADQCDSGARQGDFEMYHCSASWNDVADGNYAIGGKAAVQYGTQQYTAQQYNIGITIPAKNITPITPVKKINHIVPPQCTVVPYGKAPNNQFCINAIQPVVSGNNVKVTWTIQIPDPANNPVTPKLVSYQVSSPRYFTLAMPIGNPTSTTELPTKLVPLAKYNQVGAWSSQFAMPYKIQGKARAINVGLAEGSPMLQFTTENSAIAAFNVISIGTPAKPDPNSCGFPIKQPDPVAWIIGGPQHAPAPYPDLMGRMGELGNDGTLAIVKAYIDPQCSVITQNVPISKGSPITKKVQTRYVTYKTVNYYAVYAPHGSYWVHSEFGTNINDFALHLGADVHGDNSPVSACIADSKGEVGSDCHFVLSLLPPDTNDKNAVSRAKQLEKVAFNYIKNSKVKYSVSASGKVTTNYSVNFLNNGKPVETLDAVKTTITQVPNQAVLGLMPNQYFRLPSDDTIEPVYPFLQDAQGVSYVYHSVLGDIKPILGSSFSTDFQYHGILPFMPPIPSADGRGLATAKHYLDTYLWRSGMPRLAVGFTPTAAKALYGFNVSFTYKGTTCVLHEPYQANTAPVKPLQPEPNTACNGDKATGPVAWYPHTSYFAFQNAADHNKWDSFLYFSLAVKYKGQWVDSSNWMTPGKLSNVLIEQCNADGVCQKTGASLQGNNPAFSNTTGQLSPTGDGQHYMNAWDPYFGGKRLNQMVQAAQVAKQLGDSYVQAKTTEAAYNMLNLFFGYDPTGASTFSEVPLINFVNGDQQKDQVDREFSGYYFAWDPTYKTLLSFPASFGSPSLLNDHIFHYGYFVNAAAQLAMLKQEPEFLNEYGPNVAYTNDPEGVIDDLIFDYSPHIYNSAGRPEINSNYELDGIQTDANGKHYYDLSDWDPYVDHAWASGADTSMDGPNIESSSEQINAFAGMILWGELTHQPSITKEGIYLYTSAVRSAYAYWFARGEGVGTDTNPNNSTGENFVKDNFPDNFIAEHPSFNGYAVADAQASLKSSTFFGVTGFAQLAINVVPITGASLYLGHFPQQVGLNYLVSKYQLANWNQMGPNNPFDANGNDVIYQVLLAEYSALSNNTANADGPLFNSDANGLVNASYWNPNDDSDYCAPYQSPNKTLTGAIAGNECMDDGETRVHAYAWMRSLHDYGLPDYNITSTDSYLATVFQNAAGKKTYVAYNPTSTDQTVMFSDGVSILVKPDSLKASSGVVPPPSFVAPNIYTLHRTGVPSVGGALMKSMDDLGTCSNSGEQCTYYEKINGEVQLQPINLYAAGPTFILNHLPEPVAGKTVLIAIVARDQHGNEGTSNTLILNE